MRSEIKARVSKMLFSDQAPKVTDKHKHKNLNTLETSMSANFPNNELFVKLEKRMVSEAMKHSNILTFDDIKTRVLSKNCERFELSMSKIKQKGFEAVASIRDKRLTFLQNGIHTSSYKFITPTILKEI